MKKRKGITKFTAVFLSVAMLWTVMPLDKVSAEAWGGGRTQKHVQ